MKKSFIIIFLSLLWCSVSFAINDVKISRITVGSSVLDHTNLRGITITPDDTLNIFYLVQRPDVNPSEISFKAFLNAKITETTNLSINENYSTFTDLEKGNYIFKIQAFGKAGWEANPAIMQFSVGDVSSFNLLVKPEENENDISASFAEKKPEEINSMDDVGISTTTLVLYGLIALTFIQLIVIGFLAMKKRKAAAPEIKNIEKIPIEPGTQHLKMPDDKEMAKKKNPELINELKDLHLSYNQLKKELDNLKGTNTFLKNQIASLQLNVKNLETANSDLANQKDRLIDSKHQLLELQEQKDKLFAMAVHDIKNPAAAIRSYVELLDSYDLNANEQHEIMQSLVDTSSRIVNLAQQMSVIIATQAPEPALSLESASIKNIIDSICNRNYAYAKRKNIKLINNSSPHTPKTLLDTGKMEEVIDNLVNNAIKFAPEDTVVQVRTFFSDTKITVEVEDNGVGLSEDDLKKAFEKGARLTAQPTGGESSSGLGLWIVKNIIEDHGGIVWAKSKIGMGSTFAFELPMVGKN